MKSKFKKAFYTLSCPIITILPLITTSCISDNNDPSRNLINDQYYNKPKEPDDNAAYESYYSETLLGDGSTKVIRKHQPHTFLGFKGRLWDKKSIKYFDLIQYNLMDDTFKEKNKELLARIEVLQSPNHEKMSELEALLWSTERRWSLDKIVENWREYNIVKNRDKVFQLINNIHEFPQEHNEVKDKFKDVDFNQKSILIINGLDHTTTDTFRVAKESGMWLEAIKGNDKKLSFHFKYKYESLDKTVAHAFDHHATTHIVMIDKITSWDGYEIEVFTPGINDYR